MFQQAAGIKLLHVPYRGGGPALTAFLGEQVDITAQAPGPIKPHRAERRGAPAGELGRKRTAGACRRPDHDRARLQGRRILHLGRPVRAEGHAGAGHHAAARRHARGDGEPAGDRRVREGRRARRPTWTSRNSRSSSRPTPSGSFRSSRKSADWTRNRRSCRSRRPMDKKPKAAPSASPPAIVAAGGIVVGRGAHEGKIAVVRRKRYRDEVALPKGKQQGDEAVELTALREVKEETGLQATVCGYAGSTHYFVGSVPKVVFYYLMEAASAPQPRDTDEIEAVEWMTPDAAVDALTHQEGRQSCQSGFWRWPQGTEMTIKAKFIRACLQLSRIMAQASWTPARKFVASLS